MSFSNKSSQTTYKKPSSFAEALLEVSSSPNDRPVDQAEKATQSETNWQEIFRRERHKEVVNTQVFSQEQLEVEKKISEVQAELKKLAEEIAHLATDIGKSIETTIANPGTYHLNFFESLKRYLHQLRKQVAESKDWLAVSQQRKQAQNHYWGSVKKAGTSFMLSSERTSATQSG